MTTKNKKVKYKALDVDRFINDYKEGKKADLSRINV